jgi:magnesium chelatase family protein
MKSADFRFPANQVTVNLAPADMKKNGTVYDLPLLLGILSAAEYITPLPDTAAFIGELSLSGEVRSVNGAISMALAAERIGIKELYLPSANAAEASFADGVTVYPVTNITELLEHLQGRTLIEPVPAQDFELYTDEQYTGRDFLDVKGQENVKRALEIAVSGGHNILMCGPPGSGKSMLASRLPSIFPKMSRAEALESTEIHSIAGETGSDRPIVSSRPFRSPHHTVSQAGIAGGGSNPRPGEISLAHNGVLFLDELPEFSRPALESLRQPMEEGEVTISRASGSLTYPSRFMLVCAMNPCRCGWSGTSRCTCTDNAVKQYRSKVSGPLLDRIDIYVGVRSLRFDELRSEHQAESSADIRARVNVARELQRERYRDDGIDCNAQMSGSLLNKWCRLDDACTAMLRAAFAKLNMTGRSHDKILRVARTIADLDGGGELTVTHLAEALQYRSTDFDGNGED